VTSWEPGFRDVPRRIELAGGLVLRAYEPEDLDRLVEVVNANLEHLRPWMPWAAELSDGGPQRQFLGYAAEQWAAGNEFNYGLFDAAGAQLGGFGLHARNGPGVLEIGYWLAVAATGRGVGTAATLALTRLGAGLPGVDRIEIRCDERNLRSAAIPRRLGFRLVEVETRPPTAPAEGDRHEIWSIDAAEVRAAQ
jgi:RimJ/RimL family protein N-acetyltransferase